MATAMATAKETATATEAATAAATVTVTETATATATVTATETEAATAAATATDTDMATETATETATATTTNTATAEATVTATALNDRPHRADFAGGKNMNGYDTGGLPEDWKPSPQLTIGCLMWKHEQIERSVGTCHQENHAFDAGELGVFCTHHTGAGYDYFWVKKENFHVVPSIDWHEMMRVAMNPVKNP